MNKKDLERLEQEIMMADILLRITALEQILVEKKLITNEEIVSRMKDLSEQVAKSILAKANVSTELSQLTDQEKQDIIKN